MAENNQVDATPGIASLVGGLVEDSQQLFMQQLALVRREMQDELDKAKAAGAVLGGGLAVLAVGAVLLGVMVAKLLQLTGLPEWSCYALAGVAFAAIGGIMLANGAGKVNQISLVPPQTADTLRRDVEAVATTVATGTSTPMVRH
jgi:protein-S-isoprenylcysteine O-methyltransferase Ste14